MVDRLREALEPERIVRLEDDAVVVLDQRQLPDAIVDLRCHDAAELAEAIRTLAVRGAPAIGVAAAYGMALAAARGDDMDAAYETLAASRPTAINLRWALDEMRPDPTRERARRIHEDEVERCRRMGAHAAELVPASARILTHCNAGGLATGGYGSAVGAIRAAWERGSVDHVWVDETRPLLQGARLTAFEMEALGIPYAVIVDGAAASRMAAGEVDIVITGADRIAANGDSANKIGTYGLAVLARHHGIPFLIVAPTSTIDPGTPDGAAIPIEERDGAEVTDRFTARNPAFDVTPAELITAIVTEEGVHRAPFRRHAAGAGAIAMILDEVDAGTRAMLERHAFDADTFDRLRAELVAGTLTPGLNVVRGRRRGPAARRPHPDAAPASRGFDEAFAAGTEALRAGSIATVVLAGGMATRFGGGVKAVAAAIDGRSFLEVKLGETRRLADALDCTIPEALMTSFATDDAIGAHLAERRPRRRPPLRAARGAASPSGREPVSRC